MVKIKSFNEYSYDNYLDYEISEDVLTTKRFSDLINIELPSMSLNFQVI